MHNASKAAVLATLARKLHCVWFVPTPPGTSLESEGPSEWSHSESSSTTNKMAPSGSDIKERIKSTGSAIRDALTGRSEDTKPPDYLQALLDTRGTANMSATWLATVKQALDRGDADRCRGILETFLETAPNNLEAQLLLVQVCQQLGPDYLDEAIAVSRWGARPTCHLALPAQRATLPSANPRSQRPEVLHPTRPRAQASSQPRVKPR